MTRGCRSNTGRRPDPRGEQASEPSAGLGLPGRRLLGPGGLSHNLSPHIVSSKHR